MYTFPVSPIRPVAPVKRKPKAEKTTAPAETEADAGIRKTTRVQARAPRKNPQAAPKSAVAMSSPGVQAALTFLKSGG